MRTYQQCIFFYFTITVKHSLGLNSSLNFQPSESRLHHDIETSLDDFLLKKIVLDQGNIKQISVLNNDTETFPVYVPAYNLDDEESELQVESTPTEHLKYDNTATVAETHQLTSKFLHTGVHNKNSSTGNVVNDNTTTATEIHQSTSKFLHTGVHNTSISKDNVVYDNTTIATKIHQSTSKFLHTGVHNTSSSTDNAVNDNTTAATEIYHLTPESVHKDVGMTTVNLVLDNTSTTPEIHRSTFESLHQDVHNVSSSTDNLVYNNTAEMYQSTSEFFHRNLSTAIDNLTFDNTADIHQSTSESLYKDAHIVSSSTDNLVYNNTAEIYQSTSTFFHQNVNTAIDNLTFENSTEIDQSTSKSFSTANSTKTDDTVDIQNIAIQNINSDKITALYTPSKSIDFSQFFESTSNPTIITDSIQNEYGTLTNRDEKNVSKQNRSCAMLIPDSLNHRIDITFSVTTNVSEDDVAEMFGHLLRQTLNGDSCNFIIQTSFTKAKFFHYSWTNMSINSNNCNDKVLEELQNKMFNNSRLSKQFSIHFLPIFRLESVVIHRLATCLKTEHHVTKVVLLTVCAMCLFPCVFLLCCKLCRSHWRGHSKQKTIKNALHGRSPIIFNEELLVCNSACVTNEAFCQNDEA